jgi:ubiquinone/menaquinone biosynthesis C-methylase UbiE
MFSLLEHVVKPEAVVREATRVLKKKGIVIVQLPNLQWFIEPHTKWPLLGLMPNSIREVVRRAINYGYINFNTTVRSLIKAFEQSGLTLVALEYFWHGVKRIMFKYYPPAYLLIFRKVDKPIVA